jgi:Tfp pilus assembly protein PilX
MSGNTVRTIPTGRLASESGAALVMALIFMVILTILGILAINYSTTGLQVVGEVKQEAILAQTADAGIEQVKTALWSMHPWNTDSAVTTALTPGNYLIANTALDNNASNYLLMRQQYNVTVKNVNGPDLITVVATATNMDTNQSKRVEAVLHYFAINPDQAGQGAENSNVIN